MTAVSSVFPWLWLAALAVAAHALKALPQGSTLVFALAAGTALGLLLQRTRFCFYCHARDWLRGGDPRGLLAILLALAVAVVGYTVVVGSWVALPQAGQLPPELHIGPVSWVLVLAGLAFGAGMVVSGSCISAHWYRLAEGSPTSPFALIGAALGFVLAFNTWNPLYSLAVADAPVVWLPAHLGYGGALLLQLGVLAAAAAWLWRSYGRRSQAAAKPATPSPARAGQGVPTLAELWRRLWQGRWPYWLGGLGVGLIVATAIVRMRPLGVTTTLGSAARSVAQAQGWAPARLDGLDGFAGCATLPGANWLTPHALLLAGLVSGAFIGALASGQFSWPRFTLRDAARGLGGGVLLGWGAMTGLGCTVGTLLSGIAAGALSGWVFALSLWLAIWLGLRIQARWGPNP